MKNRDKVLDGFEGELIEELHKAIEANLKRHASILKKRMEAKIKRTFDLLRAKKNSSA